MLRKLSENLSYIMDQFYPIGILENREGVTRLGYTDVEDEMHRNFLEMAHQFGLKTEVDEVGNSYAYLGDFEKYHLIGSHLDSVVDGGRYDGVAGVAAGLAIMKCLIDEDKILPIKTVAFRCEESANFMNPMIGSNLKTGQQKFEDIKDLKSKQGKTLEEIFESRGYSTDPKIYDDIIDYVELHIEQGRVLEENKNEIGIVNVIAGSVKVIGEVKGMAEHAGATPMNLREDSLAAVAEITLEVERLSKAETETSVGTVGYIENMPNSLNVIPGFTKFSIDIRDIKNESMLSLREKIVNRIDEICKARGVVPKIRIPSLSPAVELSERMINEFENIAKRDNYAYQIMPSGAGHDCGKMTFVCDSILIFVPCKGGVSHNPAEYVSIEEIAKGTELIMKYLLVANKVVD